MDFFNKVKDNVVRFIVKNKTIIAIVCISLICSMAIAIGIYAQVTNKKIIDKKTPANEETYLQLKQDFNTLFNNELNEHVELAYDIEQEKQRCL